MESNRIKLVPPSTDYIKDILSAVLESQKELGEYLDWVQYALTYEATEQEVLNAIQRFEMFETELRFNIICKENEGLLGCIGLLIIDKNIPWFEIGYWLRTSAAGCGYMAEAVSLIENYAFTNLNAKRLEIRAAEENGHSRKVAERAGYHFEACLKNARRLPSGQLSNTVIYAKTTL